MKRCEHGYNEKDRPCILCACENEVAEIGGLVDDVACEHGWDRTFAPCPLCGTMSGLGMLAAATQVPDVFRGATPQEEVVIGRDFGFGGI